MGALLSVLDKELPHLQCLDLENVTSITDKLAAYYLPGLKFVALPLMFWGGGFLNRALD
jgi:hypothetical protein